MEIVRLECPVCNKQARVTDVDGLWSDDGKRLCALYIHCRCGGTIKVLIASVTMTLEPVEA